MYVEDVLGQLKHVYDCLFLISGWGRAGIMLCYVIRVRVRERLSATPGHVIGQGPAPGGGVVPCGGGGRGECTFLRVYGLVLKSC